MKYIKFYFLINKIIYFHKINLFINKIIIIKMGCIPSSHDHHQQQQVTNQPQKRQQKQLSKNDQTIIELKIVRDKLTGKE